MGLATFGKKGQASHYTLNEESNSELNDLYDNGDVGSDPSSNADEFKEISGAEGFDANGNFILNVEGSKVYYTQEQRFGRTFDSYTQAGDWNSVKNASFSSSQSSAENIEFNGFVHADVNIQNDADNFVIVNAAKRGNIVVGDGNDQVSLSLATNNSGWSNQFFIDTNDGTDYVKVGRTDNSALSSFNQDANFDLGIAKITDGSLTSLFVDLGAGGDEYDSIATGGAKSSIKGGKGDDNLLTSFGNDTFRFEQGDGLDSITDFGGSNDTLKFEGGFFDKSEVAFHRDGTTLTVGYGKVGYGDFTNNITISNAFASSDMSTWDAGIGAIENLELDSLGVAIADLNAAVEALHTFAQTEGIAFNSVGDAFANTQLMDQIATSYA